MLPQKHRISRSLFQDVFVKGRRYHSPHLSLSALRGATSEARIAFVASKKVLPLAVERNRLRRRGYAALRGFENILPSPVIMVFFFKKGAAQLSFSDTAQEIGNLLAQLGLL